MKPLIGGELPKQTPEAIAALLYQARDQMTSCHEETFKSRGKYENGKVAPNAILHRDYHGFRNSVIGHCLLVSLLGGVWINRCIFVCHYTTCT